MRGAKGGAHGSTKNTKATRRILGNCNKSSPDGKADGDKKRSSKVTDNTGDKDDNNNNNAANSKSGRRDGKAGDASGNEEDDRDCEEEDHARGVQAIQAVAREEAKAQEETQCGCRRLCFQQPANATTGRDHQNRDAGHAGGKEEHDDNTQDVEDASAGCALIIGSRQEAGRGDRRLCSE